MRKATQRAQFLAAMDRVVVNLRLRPSGQRIKISHGAILKRISCFRTVRHRGVVRDLHPLEVTAALSKLLMVRRQLL